MPVICANLGLTGRVHCMPKEQYPPKKGPHGMSTASNRVTREEIEDSELDAQIKASAEKASRIIQKARSKMTPEDRERADRNADAILEAASVAAKQSRRRA
jgi:hypothetical protein